MAELPMYGHVLDAGFGTHWKDHYYDTYIYFSGSVFLMMTVFFYGSIPLYWVKVSLSSILLLSGYWWRCSS